MDAGQRVTKRGKPPILSAGRLDLRSTEVREAARPQQANLPPDAAATRDTTAEKGGCLFS